MTFYEFFGVAEDATQDEVRAAYRKLLLRWHPDHCKEADAEHWTKEVLRIMKVLGDPEERARYDAYLAERRRPVRAKEPAPMVMPAFADTFTNPTFGGWGRGWHGTTNTTASAMGGFHFTVNL